MNNDINIPKELITHIDVMNTMNGGTSEPFVRLHQFDDYREIRLRIPGVRRDQIKVEINNNKLAVFYFTEVRSRDLEIQVPRVLYDKAIPYFVDIHNISVHDEGNLVVVRLPFNELADGYHKDLSTGK